MSFSHALWVFPFHREVVDISSLQRRLSSEAKPLRSPSSMFVKLDADLRIRLSLHLQWGIGLYVRLYMKIPLRGAILASMATYCLLSVVTKASLFGGNRFSLDILYRGRNLVRFGYLIDYAFQGKHGRL